MGGTSAAHHDDILARTLAVLGIEPDDLIGHDVLSGGASGSHVYRLRFSSGDNVLKITRPGSPQYLLERAQREITFYRHLSPTVQMPVPKVIGSACNRDVGACLLLKMYQPSPPPDGWSREMYIRAVEYLARFHTVYWRKGPELSKLGWLRRVEQPGGEDIRRAYVHWQRLREAGRFESHLTPPRYRWILGLLRAFDSVWSAPSSLPVTLCHGDFHIDNILVDQDGEFVLADWQEVGPGRGPEDLSFFIQRASFSSRSVPEREMVEAYRRSLVASIGEDVSLTDIRRTMDAAELRTRLLHWPAFLVDATEDQVRHLLERIEALVDSLGIPIDTDP